MKEKSRESQRDGPLIEAKRIRTPMEASGGLVAGSHKRNELVRIRHDSDSGVCRFLLFDVHFGFSS